jgi:hypothetical protein
MSYAKYYIKSCHSKNMPLNKKFVGWITMVESIVQSNLGMDLLNIPDEDYMLNYENNLTPQEMSHIILSQYIELDTIK